jgi:hypothetical protein
MALSVVAGPSTDPAGSELGVDPGLCPYCHSTVARLAASRTDPPSTVTLASSRPATGSPTKISSGPSGGSWNTQAPNRQRPVPPPPPVILKTGSVGMPWSSLLIDPPPGQVADLPALLPSANRTPTRSMRRRPASPITPTRSCAVWGFVRITILIVNPFGYTLRQSTQTATASFRWRRPSTAKVAGSVPSDGRSQAGGPHWRIRCGFSGGNGSKKDTFQRLSLRSDWPRRRGRP